MSDPLTRDELTARLEAVEARSDARFKEIMGEIKASNATISGKIDLVAAKSAGKWTVWGAALTIAGILIGSVLVFGQAAQTGYDTGWNARDEAGAATK